MSAWGSVGGTTIHTATHFGAPPACAAALAMLSLIDAPAALAGIRERGAALKAAITSQTRDRGVVAVRGPGLMIGVELEGGGGRALAVTQRLLARGYIVLTGGVRGDVLTLTPAFDVDVSLFEPFARALAESLAERSS